MKAKAAVHLRGITLIQFIAKATLVQTQLQDAMFSAITPTPAEVLPMVAQLKELYNETERRNYSRIATREEVFEELKRLFARQCMAVNGLAQGDIYILEKSGFDLARKASNPGIAEPPVGISVNRGMEAWHVKVRFGRVPSRHYYEVHVTDAAGNNHHYTCRNTTCIITDLAPNQQIQVRVRAINSCGEGMYSCTTSYYISQGVMMNRTPKAA